MFESFSHDALRHLAAQVVDAERGGEVDDLRFADEVDELLGEILDAVGADVDARFGSEVPEVRALMTGALGEARLLDALGRLRVA